MKPLIQFSSIVDTGVKLWSQLLKDNTPIQMNDLLKPDVTPEYNRPKHHLIMMCVWGEGGGLWRNCSQVEFFQRMAIAKTQEAF